AFARVEPSQTTVQLAEHIAHKLPDLPQRMVRRNPSLGCDVGKQPTLIHKCAPHASLRRFVTKKLNHDAITMASFFQRTASQKRQSTGRIAAAQHRPIDKSEPEQLPSS